MLWDDLVCPVCYQRISGIPNACRCSSCGTCFPVCDGDLPILIASDQEMVVARAYHWLQESMWNVRKNACDLESQVWSPKARDATRVRLIEAYRQNLSILTELETKITQIVSPAALYVATKAAASGGAEYWDFSNHLERDWSWLDSHEKTILAVEEAINFALERADADYDSAAVLGAGMGRFAYDYARSFRRVWAFESSITMALAYRLVTKRPFRYHYVNLKNSATSAEQVQAIEVSKGVDIQSGGGRGELTYVVADARHLPIATGAASAVLSIFFSDVVPLHDIIREASRVLPIGGTLVHFGPLEYHFEEPRNMLSAEEVRGAVIRAGFEITYEQWVPIMQQRSLVFAGYRNWCFAAKKRAEFQLSRDCVLHVSGGTVIETTTRVLLDGTRELRAVVISPWGRRVEVASPALDLLAHIDGTRSLGEVLLRVGVHTGEQGETQDSLEFLVHKLQREGIVAGS